PGDHTGGVPGPQAAVVLGTAHDPVGGLLADVDGVELAPRLIQGLGPGSSGTIARRPGDPAVVALERATRCGRVPGHRVVVDVQVVHVGPGSAAVLGQPQLDTGDEHPVGIQWIDPDLRGPDGVTAGVGGGDRVERGAAVVGTVVAAEPALRLATAVLGLRPVAGGDIDAVRVAGRD